MKSASIKSEPEGARHYTSQLQLLSSV